MGLGFRKGGDYARVGLLIETPAFDGMLYSGSEIANAGARWFLRTMG
jgi:hypothetical protein